MVQRASFVDGIKGGHVWLPWQLLGVNVKGVQEMPNLQT